MKLTIDQMLLKIAYMTEEELLKTEGSYQGDYLVLANNFLDGINVGYEKILREKFILKAKDTIILDADGCFNISQLSKNCIKINYVSFGGDDGYDFEILEDEKVKVTLLSEFNSVDVTYNYITDPYSIPADLETIPAANYDHMILCYYAAYYYLMTTGADTKNFLNLFNEGYSNIYKIKKSKRVGKHYD